MKNMSKAAFALKNYRFKKAKLDLSSIEGKCDFSIDFNPKGSLREKDKSFSLSIVFSATSGENNSVELISIECEAIFVFDTQVTLDTIPDYFYANSIAIIFPYIRAFVSTITLQANIIPILLPTYNLTFLKEKLKEQTTLI